MLTKANSSILSKLSESTTIAKYISKKDTRQIINL